MDSMNSMLLCYNTILLIKLFPYLGPNIDNQIVLILCMNIFAKNCVNSFSMQVVLMICQVSLKMKINNTNAINLITGSIKVAQIHKIHKKGNQIILELKNKT